MLTVGLSLFENPSGHQGAPARSINKFASRVGPLWQDESFDHVLRGTKAYEKRLTTFDKNPARSGLVDNQNRINGFGLNVAASRP
jgi:hypothetical protein